MRKVKGWKYKLVVIKCHRDVKYNMGGTGNNVKTIHGVKWVLDLSGRSTS